MDRPHIQKNVRNPNHHFFSKSIAIHLQFVLQHASNLYCSTPPICIAVLLVPLRSEEREILSVLLPFVSQYASHLYYNTPPIWITVLLRKSWWLWSPGCSPHMSQIWQNSPNISKERSWLSIFQRQMKFNLKGKVRHCQSKMEVNSTCSFCHLHFVKEFPRFGRKVSAKIS